MRKVWISVSALLWALGLWGCAGDVGGSDSLLRAVDEDAMTSQVLYMAPDVSAVPLTASQLEAQGVDQRLATPVRIEIFDDMAVAWHAPEGQAIIARDSIVAVWDVVQRREISGELSEAPGLGTSVITPGSTDVVVDLDETPTIDVDLANLGAQEIGPTPAEQTIIDFLDRLGSDLEQFYIARIVFYHPGCA